jgi:hypothetical protein
MFPANSAAMRTWSAKVSAISSGRLTTCSTLSPIRLKKCSPGSVTTGEFSPNQQRAAGQLVEPSLQLLDQDMSHFPGRGRCLVILTDDQPSVRERAGQQRVRERRVVATAVEVR